MVNQAVLIRSLELLLVLLAAWLVAGMIMRPDVVAPPSDSSEQTGGTAQSTAIDATIIRETPLFGVIDTSKPAEVETPAPAPVIAAPPLTLKLWGTIVAGESSVAILAVGSDPEQKIFTLHGSIESGVTLEQVWSDAVEVHDHGRKRRIELRESVDGGEVSPAPVAPPPAQGPMVQRSVSRQMLNRHTSNFSQLLSQARVVPHFLNGQADGFIITDIVPRSLFEEIGLRNNDIIRKVNQAMVTSAAQAMQLYQSLQQASEIQLEVERGGQIQTINYHIQ